MKIKISRKGLFMSLLTTALMSGAAHAQVTWEAAQTIPEGDGGFHTIAFGHGKYLASSSQQNLISLDGRNWTQTTATHYFNDIIPGRDNSGANQFVATTNAIYTSPDGIQWFQKFKANYDVYSVTYDGQKTYVAVGWGGYTYKSTNGGNTWTTKDITQNNNASLTEITYTNGQYVAVGENGLIMTSPDANTWTQRASGLSSEEKLYDVVYGDKGYLASGKNTTTYSSFILTSKDGVEWAKQNADPAYNITDVTYANGIYVAVGQELSDSNSNLVLTSIDGQSWVKQTPLPTPPGGNAALFAITYGNGQFVATGFNYPIQISSEVTPSAPDQTLVTIKNTPNYLAIPSTDQLGRTVIYGISVDATNGSASASNQLLSYTPKTDYIGGDSFKYDACNAYVCNEGNVSVNVVASGTPYFSTFGETTVSNVNASVKKGGSISLRYDVLGGLDVDSNPSKLRYVITSAPKAGTAYYYDLDSNGIEGGYIAYSNKRTSTAKTDSFNYKVCDTSSLCSIERTVSLSISR